MTHISIASANTNTSHPRNVESIQVEELIPEHLRASSQKFIDLIKDYYKHLNSSGLPSFEINRIVDEHDIDATSAKYLDGIQGEIAKNIPDSRVMSRTELYKKIVKYYSVKGSEESIATFFRIFFDEIVSVSYPKDRLMSLSSGNWNVNQNKYVKTVIASRELGATDFEYNWSPFDLTDKDGEITGTGKITEVNPIVLYDTPPNIKSLSLDLNARKLVNTVNETWDSNVLKNIWRGYFINGARYDDSRRTITLDGSESYVDFGDIGLNDIKYEDSGHTFAIRTKLNDKTGNSTIQPLFSIADDYKSNNSLELYYNRETKSIGRSFVDNNEPLIKSIQGDVVYELSNFTDTISANLSDLKLQRYEHLENYLLPISPVINGKWISSLLTFNDKSVYLHESDLNIAEMTLDDLKFYAPTGTSFPLPKFTEIGSEISGGVVNQKLGTATDVSGNGSIIAVSSGDSTPFQSVAVYSYSADISDWLQLGNKINMGTTDQSFGSSVSLSYDGLRIAVSDSDANNVRGEVYVYDFDANTDAWIQVGGTIVGEANTDRAGKSLCLNSAGDILAVGANGNDGGGSLSGHTRIHKLIGGVWTQIGQDIDGQASGDLSGRSTDLNGSGDTVIVSAQSADINGNKSGSARVFRYDDSNDIWNQLGQTLHGEREGDKFSTSVTISDDGHTIAVGAPNNYGSGYKSGHARVFALANNQWVQKGTDIDGEFENSTSGAAIGISGDGKRLIVGARRHAVDEDTGNVELYEFDERLSDWVRFSDEIVGKYEDAQAGFSCQISKDGNTIIIGAPFGENDYALVLGLSKNHITTMMYHEKDTSSPAKSRWAIRSNQRILTHTDWYDAEEFEDILPDNLNLKWNISYHQGNDNYPVRSDVQAVKSIGKYIYKLNNRGSLSIYKVHGVKHIPWQTINIGDSTEYDGDRLWEIMDYDVDEDRLVILDRTLKELGGEFDTRNSRDTRVLIFKTNELEEYKFEHSFKLDLSENYRKFSEFTYIKYANSQIVVGTHSIDSSPTNQIIRSYSASSTGIWSRDNYVSLGSIKYDRVSPKLEFSYYKNVSDKIVWRSLNSKAYFDSPKIAPIDDGITFESDAVSSKILLNQARVGDKNYVSFAIRFKSSAQSNEYAIASVGNVKIANAPHPIVVDTSALKICIGDYDFTLGLNETPLIEDEYNSITEVFNDEYRNYAIKSGEWNNLIVEIKTNPSTDVVEGIRYSLNGFKHSGIISGNEISDINTESRITVHKNIAITNVSMFDKKLSVSDFDNIEAHLNRFTDNRTIGINSVLDNGRFEINESGSVIVKVASRGIHIWENSENGWKAYYNPVEYITNDEDQYIRQNRGGSFSYKFFGDILLLCNGGVNAGFRYDDSIPSTLYNLADHHTAAKVHYIKSEYTISHSAWKVNQTVYCPTTFSQTAEDNEIAIGLNYGADISIDRKNETFALSYEPNTAGDAYANPSSLNALQKIVEVKYHVLQRIANDYLKYIPINRRDSVSAETYGRTIDNKFVTAPKYSAALYHPFLLHSGGASNSLVEYVYNDSEYIYRLSDKPLSDDFVISTPHTGELYSTVGEVALNEYQIFLIRGVADRYNGSISISINGSDFEEIYRGNTLKTLSISPNANVVLGRNESGYLNGNISHAQFYTSSVNNATKNEIVEYFTKSVLDFFEVIFEDLEGTPIGATHIKSKSYSKDIFQYTNLEGHAFDSFWFFNEIEPSNENARIRINANYNDAVVEPQKIYWGDGRSSAVLDANPIIHVYTTDFTGEYTDRKGRVSSINRIQDSNFWQQFSYNIKTSIRVDDWEKEFVNLVHPAGLKFFASVVLLVIRDNYWLGPKFIKFDKSTRENTSLIRVEDKFLSPYRTNQPLEDMRWLESLSAPNKTGGYHLPIVQPGWLQGDIRVREFLFEAGQWTKLARSVPGDTRAAKYAYEYIEGDKTLDRDIRVLSFSGDPLAVNDKVYQNVDGGFPMRGAVTKIGIDNGVQTALVRLLDTPTKADTTPESQRAYSLAGSHNSQLDGDAFVADVNNNHLDDFITLNLLEDTDIYGLAVQGGSNDDSVTINWDQIASDVNLGPNLPSTDSFTDFNADGTVFAVGFASSQKTQVYHYDAGSWQQLGSDILGEDVGDLSGTSISLNAAGDTIAIGAPLNGDYMTGHVRIYGLVLGVWTQIGQDIDGESTLDQFGFSVSLDAAGNTVAIGSIYNEDETGHVRVYENVSNVWEQVANDIDGKVEGDQAGIVELADDGTTLVVNSKISGEVDVYNKGLKTVQDVANPEESSRAYSSVYGNAAPGSGYARSKLGSYLSWTPTLLDKEKVDIGDYSAWMQMDLGSIQSVTSVITQGLNHEQIEEWVTKFKVGTSIDGLTFTEVPTTLTDNVFIGNVDKSTQVVNAFDIAETARYVRIYPTEYHGNKLSMRAGLEVSNAVETWDKFGQTLTGSIDSISINGSGNVIVVGESASNTVKIYKYYNGAWSILGDAITNVSSNLFGKSVSLSDDGYTVAISSQSDHSEVYRYKYGVWSKIGDAFNSGTCKLNSLGDKMLHISTSADAVTDSFASVFELDVISGWVTTATIQYAGDDMIWQDVPGSVTGIPTGISDYNSHSVIDFTAILVDDGNGNMVLADAPINARYIRIAPQLYNNIPALRLDIIVKDNSANFIDGDIYTIGSSAKFATITAIPLKKKIEMIDVYDEDAQAAAYAQQDRSSIDVNSEMFVRAILMTFKYLIPAFGESHVRTKDDYLQNLKFKDREDISPYLYTTIKESLNNEFIFTNVASLVTKRNQLATESGEGFYLERDDDDTKELLINDIVDWWNDPENPNDVSAPVLINIIAISGEPMHHGDMVYQDIADRDGVQVTIGGLIVGTRNDGNSLMVSWRNAEEIASGTVLPSMPQPDILFRDGTIYNNDSTATVVIAIT